MLSGCLNEPIEQTFKYQDNSTFILYPDGTYTIHFTENNKDFSGTYIMNREQTKLYLNYPVGYTESFTRIENTWVDKDGWRWERVSN